MNPSTPNLSFLLCTQSLKRYSLSKGLSSHGCLPKPAHIRVYMPPTVSPMQYIYICYVSDFCQGLSLKRPLSWIVSHGCPPKAPSLSWICLSRMSSKRYLSCICLSRSLKDKSKNRSLKRLSKYYQTTTKLLHTRVVL